MVRQWFAVQTKVRRETEALRQFERQGFRGYLPLTLVRCSHARKISWQKRAFFPGYLFLHLAPDEQRWTTIRSTIGAIGAVHFGSCYPAMPDAFITMLQYQESEEGILASGASPAAVFCPEERVKVLRGPMQGLEGVFVSMRGEDRVLIMLSWLQRRVRAELSLDDVMAAG